MQIANRLKRHGSWPNLVGLPVWDREVAGSNPADPTCCLESRRTARAYRASLRAGKMDMGKAKDSGSNDKKSEIDVDNPKRSVKGDKNSDGSSVGNTDDSRRGRGGSPYSR